jgi:N utilization substance protein B
MNRRSRAREVVLQALYQYDLNPECGTSVDAFIARKLTDDRSMADFVRSLVQGVLEQRDHLDRLVGETAENWSVDRMAVTDRNVLRLGAYELLFTDTPGGVVINEAVELAKKFGDKQSPPFVNGILDRLLKRRPTDTTSDLPQPI